MNSWRRLRFRFSQAAIDAGHSVDFLNDGAILLHLKPRASGKALAINSRASDQWDEEVRLELTGAEIPDQLEVDLLHTENGVTIYLAGEQSTVFSRCGDLHRATSISTPATIATEVEPASPALPLVTPRIERIASPVPPEQHPVPTARPPATDGVVEPAMLAELVRAAAGAKDWARVAELAADRPETLQGNRPAEIDLARALIQLGRGKEAEAVLRRLGMNGPPDEDVAYHLGLALQKQHRYDEARQFFLQCLAGHPNEARYVFEAGRTTAQCVNGGFGNFEPQPTLIDEAIDLLTRAAGLMTRDGRPHRELAAMLQGKGLLEEALAALVEAQRRSPAMTALYLEQSRLLVRLDRIEEALHQARLAAAADESNDAASSTIRILERWLDARRAGPLSTGTLTDPPGRSRPGSKVPA
ncbi:tetratricopeptide repeat protein [Pararoseomonas indoligenes]|uniref:Tetratricopeptide repeat protein n=1 Tax=Roseomonas indoligenes TaxID=2820811 RepID=A0A940MXM0_9PROT|nr:tetratricopeptide repeat protein [Pararoseomonas indoligenes]MBP0495274.1 hypothetical protein [Pararoseomonas indoligenes]